MIPKLITVFLATLVSFQVFALDLAVDQLSKTQLKETLTLLKSMNKISESDYQSTIKKLDSMSDAEFKKFLKDAGNFIADPKKVEGVKKQYGL